MVARNEVRNLLAEPAAHHTSRKKSVHLKDQRINVIHQTLLHCVSLTVIFCASQSRAGQTSLNVILLVVFFLWCLPKMYDVG